MSQNIFPELELLSTQKSHWKGAPECSERLFRWRLNLTNLFLNEPQEVSFHSPQNRCSLHCSAKQIRKHESLDTEAAAKLKLTNNPQTSQVESEWEAWPLEVPLGTLCDCSLCTAFPKARRRCQCPKKTGRHSSGVSSKAGSQNSGTVEQMGRVDSAAQPRKGKLTSRWFLFLYSIHFCGNNWA